MFLDDLEIPGDALKVATFHRNGGNFGAEWVATFKRNGGNFQAEWWQFCSGLCMFFTQSPSFLSYQQLIQRQKGSNNALSILTIQNIPCDNQVRTLLDPVRPLLLFPAHSSKRTTTFSSSVRPALGIMRTFYLCKAIR